MCMGRNDCTVSMQVIAEVVICGFSISELLPAIGEVFAAFQSASLIKRVIKEVSIMCTV